uniref:Uncharacterized protein n=1 Tax=Romanomermis culicivorax TaxID=13658 RepID=A0A915I8Q2_ROMCU
MEVGCKYKKENGCAMKNGKRKAKDKTEKERDQDTMDQFENNISTLSATERNPGYFHQLMLSE